MAVGKPDFDLNSFGVKYLSKDQVQDFLDKALGKNSGDVPEPVDDEKGKKFPKKETFTDINNINEHQNPTPIDGGGFPGKQRRTGKKDADDNPIKYTQSQDGTKPKEGNVPTSRKNNIYFKEDGLSNAERKESFDYYLRNEADKEKLAKDPPLTVEEGTEKFDDTPANRALRDRIAAREHKKKLAAEKKKKLKKANDIIMDMNIMKLDLMKRSGDLNTQGGWGKALPEELPQGFQEQSTEIRIPPASKRGKTDLGKTPKGRGAPKGTGDDDWKEVRGESFNNRYEKIKNPKHSWRNDRGYEVMSSDKAPSDLKRKTAETIFKAISLKLDLMKDINTRSSFGNVPKEEKQTFQEQSSAERIGYKPFEKPDLATTPKGGKASDKIGETSTYGDGSDTDKILNPEWTPQDGYGNQPSGKAPSDLKEKAEETIFKAISLKLDLMKDAPKDLEREGIKKKPSNMPKAGKRDFEITPDQEEAARRGDFGNRITGHDKESAITRLSDSERDWKAGHENAYGTRPINNPEGELIPPSVQNQRMGSTTNMKD